MNPLESKIERLRENRAATLAKCEAMAAENLDAERQAVLDSLINSCRDYDLRIADAERKLAEGDTSGDGVHVPSVPGSSRVYYGGNAVLEHQRSMKANNTRTNGDIVASWLRSGTPVEQHGDRELCQRHSAGQNLVLRADTGITSIAAPGDKLVPRLFYNQVFSELQLACPILSFAHVLTTDSGAPIDLPIDRDNLTNSGHWLSQLTEDEIGNPDLSTVTMNAFAATSKAILASWELLQDSGVDAASLFAAQLGRRIGKTLEAAYINGTGSGQPTGILNGAGTANGLPIHTTAASGAIGLDDLLAGIASVDPSVLSGPACRMLMSPGMLFKLRTLKDTVGRFLVNDPIEGGSPTILGYKVEVSLSVPDDSVVIANFDSFWIRQARQLELLRLNEKYALQRASAFVGWVRTDSRWISNRAGVVVKVKA